MDRCLTGAKLWGNTSVIVAFSISGADVHSAEHGLSGAALIVVVKQENIALIQMSLDSGALQGSPNENFNDGTAH